MHSFKNDVEQGFFLVELRGETTVSDLAQALTACLDASPDRIATVWDLTRMLVSFTMDEMSVLMASIAKLDYPDGRVAFVTGHSAFSKVLVNVTGELRQNRRVEWRKFTEHAEAVLWVRRDEPDDKSASASIEGCC